MKKFSWGKVIDTFFYDFDGDTMEVIKFHPWKVDGCTGLVGNHDISVICFHCEKLHESSASLQYLLISWIAYKNLGNNQYPLVYGISKALGIN